MDMAIHDPMLQTEMKWLFDRFSILPKWEPTEQEGIPISMKVSSRMLQLILPSSISKGVCFQELLLAL
jgi:hypothetical protein